MSQVFLTREEEVVSYGDYKPWGVHKSEGGDGSNYPAHSGRILDVKENKAWAVRHFADMIAPELRENILIVTIPSHDPAKTGGGLAALAAALAATGGSRMNGAGLLARTTKISKLAHGGDRSVETHLNSMRVNVPNLVAGRNVLLLDDVHKSGNSLRAGKELLLRAGAASVHCACLGKTWG